MELIVERVKHLYALQKNVVIVCGEGVVDEHGNELGAESSSSDPAGNVALSGAAEALRGKMIKELGDRYFLPTAISNLVAALLFLGDWDEAGRVLRDAVEVDGFVARVTVRAILAGTFDGSISTAPFWWKNWSQVSASPALMQVS